MRDAPLEDFKFRLLFIWQWWTRSIWYYTKSSVLAILIITIWYNTAESRNSLLACNERSTVLVSESFQLNKNRQFDAFYLTQMLCLNLQVLKNFNFHPILLNCHKSLQTYCIYLHYRLVFVPRLGSLLLNQVPLLRWTDDLPHSLVNSMNFS